MEEKSFYMFNDYPVCPHCDHENNEQFDNGMENDIALECDACGQIYFCNVSPSGLCTTRRLS